MRRLLIPSAALLWGLQFAFLQPVIALLLAALYDATPGEVGLSLAVYNVAGFVSSLVIPIRADRKKNYLFWLLLAGAFTFGCVLVLWAATSLPMAVVGLIGLGGPASVGMSLLFAQLKHSGASTADVVNTRTLTSFAWVVGPPLATFVMGGFGNRSILLVIALVALGNVAVTLVMLAEQRRRVTDSDGAPAAADAGPGLSKVAIGVVMLAVLLLQVANYATVSITALYVTRDLGLDVRWGGVALGVAAALEIPALLLVGRLSTRFASMTLLLVGCVIGALYYVGMALAQGLVTVLALQALNAGAVAVLSGIGLAWFQEVIPRAGLAASLYTNTRRVGGILAGPVIAVAGLSALGYSGVFLLAAVLAIAASVVMVVVNRTLGRAVAEPSA